ncbi:MAG TPA: hypothetical protein VIH57_03720 [Bacteroidales bacterium]
MQRRTVITNYGELEGNRKAGWDICYFPEQGCKTAASNRWFPKMYRKLQEQFVGFRRSPAKCRNKLLLPGNLA